MKKKKGTKREPSFFHAAVGFRSSKEYERTATIKVGKRKKKFQPTRMNEMSEAWRGEASNRHVTSSFIMFKVLYRYCTGTAPTQNTHKHTTTPSIFFDLLGVLKASIPFHSTNQQVIWFLYKRPSTKLRQINSYILKIIENGSGLQYIPTGKRAGCTLLVYVKEQ